MGEMHGMTNKTARERLTQRLYIFRDDRELEEKLLLLVKQDPTQKEDWDDLQIRQ